MLAFTLFFLVVGVASPYVGRVVDRYGATKVIAIGAFVAGLGFILLSLMQNLWHFYGGWIISGSAGAATTLIPVTAVVSNWFKKRRGTAIGIVGMGMGVSAVLVPVIGGYLIPNFGWRASYLVLALFTWIRIPLALLVIRTKPADMGLYPDGVEAPEAVAVNQAPLPASEGLSLKMALATSGFWLIAVSFVMHLFSQVGILQNQVPHLEDIGFPVATAASALGIVGLVSAISRFGYGWLCDRIQAKYACGICLGLQLAGVIILINIGPASPLAIIWLYAIVFGLGVGGWMPTISMLVSTSFGLASYGAIFGMITLVTSIGSGTGPLMAAYMYDVMGTYHWAFIIFLALFAVAIPAILAVRRPKAH